MNKYTFKISYEERYTPSFGYALYSSFLENLKEEAELIHKDNNFNQYITRDEWIVNSDRELSFRNEYFLQKYNTKIILMDKRVENITEQELADKFLIFNDMKKKIRIKFLTPTSFKQDSEYVLYPTKDLIMQSLTNKWNDWAKNFQLEDMEWNNCKISKYNLRSVNYNLKGVKVQGFIGSVDMFFWGGESIIRLGNMILNFGNYSGIGIKTALGMGGVFIE